MKKKLLAVTFAIIFSILSLGSYSIATTNYINSNIEVALAALTTSQTRTVQDKLKRWGYYTGSVDGIYGNLTRKRSDISKAKMVLRSTALLDQKRQLLSE